jgi:hypothetical protein
MRLKDRGADFGLVSVWKVALVKGGSGMRFTNLECALWPFPGERPAYELLEASRMMAVNFGKE